MDEKKFQRAVSAMISIVEERLRLHRDHCSEQGQRVLLHIRRKDADIHREMGVYLYHSGELPERRFEVAMMLLLLLQRKSTWVDLIELLGGTLFSLLEQTQIEEHDLVLLEILNDLCSGIDATRFLRLQELAKVPRPTEAADHCAT